jgi:hypothetical protein
MILRATLIWLVIAAAEVIHGFLRVKFLNRRVGDRRARQIGVFTGSAIIFAIAWWSSPWIGAETRNDQLGVGLLWLAAMMAFDIGFGRWVFHASWARIGTEFDLRRGGLLGLGMVFLFFAPLLVAELRNL